MSVAFAHCSERPDAPFAKSMILSDIESAERALQCGTYYPSVIERLRSYGQIGSNKA
jgi:hypothetical protein